ncbi:hypothetical protein FGG08_000560 [Glutinoglossum americanum]|uniref:Uncharacterized protein n=1 Tax=Glutinoglossum americanum TaxID=1670608 RepID=A0A9P8I8U9_9PEZI|nr:hypothetical protein FGG08_000560 [Glutinoglossum americanum]
MATSPIFKLPFEIRDQIFSLSLGVPTSVRHRIFCDVAPDNRPLLFCLCRHDSHPWYGGTDCLYTAILRTCQAISEECLDLLYSRLVFTFAALGNQDDMWTDLLWFLNEIGEKNRGRLREISMEAPYVKPVAGSSCPNMPRLAGPWSFGMMGWRGWVAWGNTLGWEVNPRAATGALQLSKLTPGLRKFELTASVQLCYMLKEEDGSGSASEAQLEVLRKIAKAFSGTGVKVVLDLQGLCYQGLKPVFDRIATEFGWELNANGLASFGAGSSQSQLLESELAASPN